MVDEIYQLSLFSEEQAPNFRQDGFITDIAIVNPYKSPTLMHSYQENPLVIANTLLQQHKRWFYTWTSPDGQYQNRLIIFFAAEDGEALDSQQKTSLGTDCGSDHELHIAKFRLKLKKVGKMTRPFRYNQIQIPDDYTMEVTKRFKG